MTKMKEILFFSMTVLSILFFIQRPVLAGSDDEGKDKKETFAIRRGRLPVSPAELGSVIVEEPFELVHQNVLTHTTAGILSGLFLGFLGGALYHIYNDTFDHYTKDTGAMNYWLLGGLLVGASHTIGTRLGYCKVKKQTKGITFDPATATKRETEDDCYTCLQPLATPKGPNNESLVVVPICKHDICAPCFIQWSEGKQPPIKCPICPMEWPNIGDIDVYEAVAAGPMASGREEKSDVSEPAGAGSTLNRRTGETQSTVGR